MRGMRLGMGFGSKRVIAVVAGGGTTRALKFNVAANSQYIPVIGA